MSELGITFGLLALGFGCWLYVGMSQYYEWRRKRLLERIRRGIVE